MTTQIDLIADCVHCGFCLPACPTYRSWGLETDSPRGRIDLMKAILEDEVPLDAQSAKHFDQCLGCMGCVTACPSGVRYDLLIEATREKVEREVPRGAFERFFRNLVFAIFPYPKRLLALAPLLNLGARLGLNNFVRGGALMPQVDLAAARQALPETMPAQGTKRARVGLLAGCVNSVMFPQVNAATVRVLSAEGCEVVVPPAAGCCGALSLHAGRISEAKAFAKELIVAFESANVDAVVTNVAGCGSGMKQYAEIFAGDAAWAERAGAFSAMVKDVSEFLAPLEPRAERRPIEARVAYHDACHLAHAQRVRDEPRALLCSIPGVRIVEIPNGEQCCGSAGTYNLFEPKSAREIGLRKVENVRHTGAKILASGNPGCSLQIGALMRERGESIEILHPIELLDRAIRPPR
jgi:glycolate oxidase iron-sulfur subunit